jgi:hypothetical protein
MTASIRLLDVVALTADLPDNCLVRGQVGTVVGILVPNVYEVEFSDDEGRSYAQLSLRDQDLMILHHQPYKAV